MHEWGVLVEMILTGESKNTWMNVCASDNLSVTNPMWTGLGSNPGFLHEVSANKRLNRVTALKSFINPV